MAWTLLCSKRSGSLRRKRKWRTLRVSWARCRSRLTSLSFNSILWSARRSPVQSLIFPAYKRLLTLCISLCARTRRLATLETCQRNPRCVGIFHSFSERVIAPMVIVPSVRSVRRIGSKPRVAFDRTLTSTVRLDAPASAEESSYETSFSAPLSTDNYLRRIGNSKTCGMLFSLGRSDMSIFRLFGSRVERRKSRRHGVIHTAWVRTGNNPVPAVAVLWDVSEGGARLSVSHPDALPDRLTITLKREDAMGTVCRVAWRDRDQIGIEFVSNPDPIRILIKQTADQAL